MSSVRAFIARIALAFACAIGGVAAETTASPAGAQTEGATSAAGGGGDGNAAAAGDQAPVDVAAMVRSMSEALRTLDYEGTFVHLVGNNLTSLHIVHANDGGGELERLSALDGEAREVFRDRSLVTCIWPDSRSVVVNSSKPRSPLPAIDASLSDNRHYRLESLSDDRVAGRATRVIEVAPLDALRYGYRFWLDSDNAMLLRSMLLDERGRALEQMMFTHIEFPDHIDPARFEIVGEGRRASWIDEGLAQKPPSVPSYPASAQEPSASPAKGGDARVDFEGLPEGYRRLPDERSSASDQHETVSHVMLGDGMASVSVYVEHLRADEQDDNVPGPARMGAINVFGLSLQNAFVTVLGEVPAETVRRIARSVRVAR